MNTEYIQNLRYKLQRRVRRLNSSNYTVFHAMLQQFWGFLKDYPIFVGLIEELEAILASSEEIKQETEILFSPNREVMITYDNELVNVTLCYSVLKKCALSDDWQIERNVGCRYADSSHHNDILEAFRDIFLEPFYDYLDERIDDQGFILSTLIRYKHKCEWFLRQELYELWCKNKNRGEMKLAQHLYQYLYDQGIDFYMEPMSVSGEADMVSAQTGEERLIADAKIFNSEKSRISIAKWYRQIYTYTVDFNESFGYLVIFKTCEHDLSFSFPEKSLQTHFFSHNNKTVFFVVIDIFSYKESASKRDRLKTTVITDSDLVQILDNDLDS